MLRRFTDIADNALQSVPEAATKAVQERIAQLRGKVRLGIITALPREAAAVNSVLGGEFIELPMKRRTHVSYYLHLVRSAETQEEFPVVVGLANQMGNNSAAVTASCLLMDFVNVESLIITGIAGGVPNRRSPARHVRLGDIVVGVNGVIQYDFLRRELGRSEFRRMGSMPSARLTGAVRQLQVSEEGGHQEWAEFLSP